MDRDTKFTQSFRDVLTQRGVEPVRQPARSPNLNAYAERLVGAAIRRSIKEKCLNGAAIRRLIFFGGAAIRPGSLEKAIREYLPHYHAERNHQGLGNELIEPEPGVGAKEGQIEGRKRLGGLLRYYGAAIRHRKAA